jgi:ABC-type multidrug transport system ATPase subunit
VEQLRFGWPGAAPLFNGLSLQAGPGLTWVCGDEGVGKTTLLALIAGALAPQAGRFEAAGIELASEPAAYRRQVFWVDPRSTEHDALPGAGYLEAAASHWPALDEELLADCVDGFGLDEHLHKPLYMLSTGSRRKLWLSAALASGAPVTLIDQPFAALDAPSMRFLRECLADATTAGARAWLVADHEPTELGVPVSTVWLPARAG